MSQRQGRDFWERIVRDLEQSGLTHGEFADQRGLNIGSLRSWLYRLRRKRRRVVRVLPVHVAGQSGAISSAFVEVAVAGTVVRAAVGTDVEYFVELVTRLRERC